MNTFKWLLKREFWEHKGAFFWAPVAVAGIMTLFIAVSLAIALAGVSDGLKVNGMDISELSRALTPEQTAAFAAKLVFGYVGIAMPIFMVFAIGVFFFCLGALYDERRDRSVLFWKSLPLSDHATVLSKVVIAIGVAPVIAMVIATATAALVALLVGIAALVLGINLFGALLTNGDFYLAPIQMTAILPVYAMWALPTIGWLLMVSAWARGKPLLWAVGVPVMSGILLSWAQRMFAFDWNTGWYWKNIVGRLLGSVMPGGWLSDNRQMSAGEHNSMTALGDVLNQSWQLFGGANIWLGAAAGALMIYAAIRLRGWRDEG